MPERKLPVKLNRSGLTERIYALTNYKVVERPGLAPLYEAKHGGKHDVTVDFEDLLLEVLLIGNEGVVKLLHSLVHGHHGEPISEPERKSLRELHKRFAAIIERHNKRVGEPPEVHSES